MAIVVPSAIALLAELLAGNNRASQVRMFRFNPGICNRDQDPYTLAELMRRRDVQEFEVPLLISDLVGIRGSRQL